MEKVNETCPNCNEGILEFVPENFPFTTDHLQCNLCDSTFSIE
jgi:hypothetical protein